MDELGRLPLRLSVECGAGIVGRGVKVKLGNGKKAEHRQLRRLESDAHVRDNSAMPHPIVLEELDAESSHSVIFAVRHHVKDGAAHEGQLCRFGDIF